MSQTPESHPTVAHATSLLDKDIYTPEEASKLLMMDIDVLYQAAHRGHLKANRIGHDIVSIQRADLLEWLQNR